mmetsp:Transcript_112056/g.194568  ORF Transcript_112056/g.194568 Transcript_112056/m.194568 type:complete len:209 (-) Transcript_112056:1105-1731(-)
MAVSRPLAKPAAVTVAALSSVFTAVAAVTIIGDIIVPSIDSAMVLVLATDAETVSSYPLDDVSSYPLDIVSAPLDLADAIEMIVSAITRVSALVCAGVCGAVADDTTTSSGIVAGVMVTAERMVASASYCVHGFCRSSQCCSLSPPNSCETVRATSPRPVPSTWSNSEFSEMHVTAETLLACPLAGWLHAASLLGPRASVPVCSLTLG